MSENWRRAALPPALPFAAVPKRRLIWGMSSSIWFSTYSCVEWLRASRVRIFPLSELPGMMGCFVSGSRRNGLSTPPMGEKSLDAPMCIPVSTRRIAVSFSFPFNTL